MKDLGKVMVSENGARSVMPCRYSAVSSENVPLEKRCCAMNSGSSQVSGSAYSPRSTWTSSPEATAAARSLLGMPSAVAWAEET